MLNAKINESGEGVTFLIPCLNEEETLPLVIEEIHENFKGILSYEIIVSDNGSIDKSREIAEKMDCKVVIATKKGYGSALLTGIQNSRYDIIVMGDADASYNFGDALMMIRKISEGQDLVMGNRFGKPMEKNAMPLLNRYLGNPVLSFLGRLFYKVKIRDFHCGLRAFRKSSLEALRLNGLGMEFASEMVIKASIFGLKIQEVPIYFRKDQRTRSPHLRRWRDGWRHLRILLTFSPNYLFAAPALIFIFFGMAMAFFGQSGNLLIGEIALSYRSSLILAFLVAMSSLMYGLQQTLTDVQSKMRGTSGIRNAAHTMIIGVTTSVIGFLLIFREFLLWRSLRYSTLETGQPLLLFTWGISLLLFGVIQIIFYVFRKVLSEHDVTETGAP